MLKLEKHSEERHLRQCDNGLAIPPEPQWRN